MNYMEIQPPRETTNTIYRLAKIAQSENYNPA